MDAKSIIYAFLQANIQTNGAEYHFNILEEQQGNIVENSHTNILIRLLSYRNRFGYIFLQSFCDRFLANFTGNINGGNIIFETESPLCGTANGRIDGLIYSKDDFAIIIENKINGAPAGEKQLEKYIKSVSENSKIFSQQTNNKYDRIWVVYLTREGNEKPDDGSCDFLTDKKQFGCAMIDGEIIGDRYAALSYSDDILPWLKEEIIPMWQEVNIILYSGLIQYIDFLDRLNMSNKIDVYLQSEINKIKSNYDKNQMLIALSNEVKKMLKTKAHGQYRDLLSMLKKSIDRIYRSLIADFINASCDYFEGNYDKGKRLFSSCHVKHSMDNNYVYFTDENWPETIHFEWRSLSTILWDEKTTKCYLYFHIEGKGLMDFFNNKSKLSLKGYTRTGYKDKISYKKEVILSKPILCMTYDELKKELIRVYSKANIANIVNEINNIIKYI